MASRVRWGTLLVWDATKIVLSALKTLLFSREYLPVLIASILYYSLIPLTMTLVMIVFRVEINEAFLGWIAIIGIPIYGLGVEIAQKQLSQNTRSIRFWGWKHRTRIGFKIVVIMLVFITLPEVILGAVTGSLTTLFPELLATLSGRNITESIWYRSVIYVGGMFILPAVLVNYIHREQLSDLAHIRQYIAIFRDQNYIVLALAFIFAQHVPFIIFSWIELVSLITHGSASVPDLAFYFLWITTEIMISLVYGDVVSGLIQLLTFSIITGMSFTLGVLLPFQILGANARSIRPLRQRWEIFYDTTVQTKLNHFKDIR